MVNLKLGLSLRCRRMLTRYATLLHPVSGRIRVEAERRQLNRPFHRHVGFTTFSERSGEEACIHVDASLAKPMEDAVRDQGGACRALLATGSWPVFGAPVAQEDAPLRACRAALAILNG